jgi:hypothetical protein
MDWPARLLTSAVRCLPAERRDWGAAMLAELAHLQQPFARRRFALGCARVALFPPRLRPFMIGGTMNVYVRKLRGVTGISLIWAPLWAVLFGLLVSILQFFLPPNTEPTLPEMMWIIAQVGFVSGSIFGSLFAWAENGKAIRDLSLGRAALWGALAAAVFPIVTGRANQLFWTCPFGAIVAVTLIALARQAARRAVNQPQRNFFFACAFLPVRDTVSPTQESAT